VPRLPVNVDVKERRDGTVCIRVTGELDVATRLLLARSLSRHEAQRVLLDMAGVTFADSAGLTAVVGAESAAARAGGSVELVAASDVVRRLLKLTNARGSLLRSIG
jgi:anti-anti-sigma factor